MEEPLNFSQNCYDFELDRICRIAVVEILVV